MARDAVHPTVLLASGSELPPSSRVWGTGGWLPPEDREALDWLVLLRMLGYKVGVVYAEDTPPSFQTAPSALIVACDASRLSLQWRAWLRYLVESTPALVIARPGLFDGDSASVEAGGSSRHFEASGALIWSGPGEPRRWTLTGPIPCFSLPRETGAQTWATLDDVPLMEARSAGLGVIATLGFHPSAARDACGQFSALLKHLFASLSPVSSPSLDLSGTVVLRMDDPGGAQNVFSADWCYPKLGRAAWRRVGEILQAYSARLSVAYISGWMDDGDATRGELVVGGESVRRVPGRVYDSAAVVYRDLTGHAPGRIYDYTEEYHGLLELQERGLVSIELHGYTHMFPDSDCWISSSDRYKNKRWFREFSPEAVEYLERLPPGRRPTVLGKHAIRRLFGTEPTTLICPGEEFTDFALEEALDAGLSLIGSYYLAVREQDRFCWGTHICAPYLDLADSRWLESELPAVGYFHDRDLALHGPGWLETQMEAWVRAGARRFIDYRTLAQVLEESRT